ncbi:hypothetical protein [Luteimicrobium subarcticum]|uniref:Copper(I)-binding protein n=1 Tax=Luteimicrobium subarcticum TaxID=620910 RepID=A0A2M8WT09_9MICO|nr:hypothetical protein [Luteimicrobium subarcticum]PJI93966.1 hypothetical protein CLV34_1447 [Luteimicrobium subarcticum]
MNRSTARLTSMIAVPVALVAAAVLSGCAPIETDKPVQISDGVDVTVGDVKGINLLVISEDEGQPGRLLGAFTNSGDADEVVNVAADGASPQTVSVAAGKTVYLSGSDDAEEVTIDTTTAAPGAVLPTTFSVSDTSEDVKVPVLDGTLPEYATLVPTAAAG